MCISINKINLHRWIETFEPFFKNEETLCCTMQLSVHMLIYLQNECVVSFFESVVDSKTTFHEKVTHEKISMSYSSI